MNRLLLTIAPTVWICVASQAHATDDSSNQSQMSKRQMITQIIGCMKRRMAADKDISYKEAMKVCKTPQPDVQVASDTHPKP
jgi:hypothetical protein